MASEEDRAGELGHRGLRSYAQSRK